MPKFSYVAMDSRGKETKGTLDVGSQNEAIARLKEMNFFPTKVVEEKGGKPEAKKSGAPPSPAAKKAPKTPSNFRSKSPASAAA